jgi:hypothetical protein
MGDLWLRLCRAAYGLTRLTAAIAGVLLLSDCRRQNKPPNPSPSPAKALQTPPSTPSPAATPTPTPAQTPSVPPPQPEKPVSSPTPSASPVAQATPTPTPDPFEVGLNQLLQASANGFRELRGKFVRTEKGSGPEPLFRVRKLYDGTLLFDGSSSAQVEEVYFHPGQQPVYNYHLFFQALSARDSIERYDQLRLNLNHMLKNFDHTFGDRYDAWASHDALKTAVLLNNTDSSGSLEIQVHVAFSKPQW